MTWPSHDFMIVVVVTVTVVVTTQAHLLGPDFVSGPPLKLVKTIVTYLKCLSDVID